MKVSRRLFVTAVGVVGSVGLAGCTGSSNSSDSSPAASPTEAGAVSSKSEATTTPKPTETETPVAVDDEALYQAAADVEEAIRSEPGLDHEEERFDVFSFDDAESNHPNPLPERTSVSVRKVKDFDSAAPEYVVETSVEDYIVDRSDAPEDLRNQYYVREVCRTSDNKVRGKDAVIGSLRPPYGDAQYTWASQLVDAVYIGLSDFNAERRKEDEVKISDYHFEFTDENVTVIYEATAEELYQFDQESDEEGPNMAYFGIEDQLKATCE